MMPAKDRINLPWPLSSFDHSPIREDDCQIDNPIFHRPVTHGVCTTVFHTLAWNFLDSIRIEDSPAIGRNHSTDLCLCFG